MRGLRAADGRRAGATLTMLWPSARNCWRFSCAPCDKADLELKQNPDGLKCVQCKRVYPIRDDIPVMLVDEARIED